MAGILTDVERISLRDEVATYTNGNPSILNGLIPTYHVIRIPTDNMPVRYAYNVVRYCEMFAWIETPSLIIRLLQNFEYLQNFDLTIKRIKTLEPPKFYLGQRPWDTILLAVDLPFLNRKITRQVIEYFSYSLISTVDPAGIRVLVVKGPKNSGKTYTYNYIRYINTCLAELNFKVVWIDVKKHFSGHFGPLELTRAILDQVNPGWKEQQVQLPELDNEQPARWIQQLCGLITEQIVFMNMVHVIVIDGLGEQTVNGAATVTVPISREVIEMVMQLTMIATGSQLPHLSNDMMRMVLLGFNQPVLNFMNRVRVDEIQPINAADLKEYFLNFAMVHKKEIDPDALQQMVNKVLAADVAADENRTEKMAARALAVAKVVIGD